MSEHEREFYQRWLQEAAELPVFEMACRGGELAGSPGLIFLAGYQAAIRATFPMLKEPIWYSFAVTEDRSPNSTRPGVTRSGNKVSGHKTWIAAVDQVDVLVIKVGSGAEAVYGTVKAAEPEVTLSSRDARFLSDMSQGSAEFRAANLVQFEGSVNAKAFGVYEPYYIYIAFLAHLVAAGIAAEAAQLALDQQARQQNLKSLDAEVSRLVNAMPKTGIGENWAVDQSLFTMYSKGIQAR